MSRLSKLPLLIVSAAFEAVQMESQQGVSYSPSENALQIALPDSAYLSASVELYDVSGRLTGRTTADFNGGSAALVPLTSLYSGQLPNGVYLAVIRWESGFSVCTCVVVR